MNQTNELLLAQLLRRIGAGVVTDLLFDHRAVNIVNAKGQRNLRDLHSQHHPVRLDVLEIIEVEPANSQCLEGINSPDSLGPGDPGIIRLKSQGDKGLETAGSIL